jgi:hypothetical protein
VAQNPAAVSRPARSGLDVGDVARAADNFMPVSIEDSTFSVFRTTLRAAAIECQA